MNTDINKRPQIHYRGRFAPSPSGSLHFGSLITALASFLDAKKNNGVWLVRIEDIDPPREKKGASTEILSTLASYGLHWDEEVLYQRHQHAYYQQIIAELFVDQLSYYCRCTRAQIKASGGIYNQHCRHLNQPKSGSAIRVKNDMGISHFTDIIQGDVHCDPAFALEDFAIYRKDNLFAYQLAVVADDIFQNISHVIRGCDLVEPTVKQLSFYQILQQTAPLFGHIPLAITEQGYKLSKQNKAPAINIKHPQPLLISALEFLGQQPEQELVHCSVEEIISWSIKHWNIHQVPKRREIKIA